MQSSDIDYARKVASQMRAGNVHLNYPTGDTVAPFGGYKIKAVIGYRAAEDRAA